MPEATTEAQPEELPTEIFKKEGNEFFAQKDYVKAVAAYNQAIKADPSNGVLYSNRAAAFIQLGKEIKAIKDAESAIKFRPDWAKGYFRKGAALVALRRWSEAVDVLKMALEREPKSKEIGAMLRDAQRKKAAEKGESKREESKGLKLVASNKDLPTDGAPKIPLPSSTPIGFSEKLIENFVQDSLKSAITQYAHKGELKSIVYMQPSKEGEGMLMVGVEAGFDSPQANEQCVDFLRGHAADNKVLAVIVMAEKKNIAYPQVWLNKSKDEWKFPANEQGIFMQLDALAVGATDKVAEQRMWFIATPVGKSPAEPVELQVDTFAIMPPLLR